MDTVRQIGKYVVITTCIIAVAHGIIYRQYFAPFEISLACWGGLLLWVVGFAGVKIQKYMASRSLKKANTR
jgi:uncharacterized membrane protein (DUF373 family)